MTNSAPDRQPPLSGKIALISGGAQGIGRAIAECFQREGARVLLLDCDCETGHNTAEQLSNLDPSHPAQSYCADLACPDDVQPRHRGHPGLAWTYRHPGEQRRYRTRPLVRRPHPRRLGPHPQCQPARSFRSRQGCAAAISGERRCHREYQLHPRHSRLRQLSALRLHQGRAASPLPAIWPWNSLPGTSG